MRSRLLGINSTICAVAIALGAVPGCAPEERPALGEESALATSSSDIVSRARAILDARIGITQEEALTEAMVAATAAAGRTIKKEDVEVDYLVRRLGPGALPFLLDRPWRREGFLSEWQISQTDATKILRSLAERGASDVVANAIDALLRHASLTDAYKRRLIAASLTSVRVDAHGQCVVDPALSTDISAEELTQKLGSGDSRSRSLLASLLHTKAFGFDALEAETRRASIDQLLADSDFTVRLAASPLFWEASDTSADAQRSLIAILDAPDTVANVRLSQIFSMGWSRERADMWGMPDGVADQLLDARAVFLGNLLERAAPSADITYLLDETARHGSFAGVTAEAARRVLDATTLGVNEQAAWFEKLAHGEDDISRTVAQFAWAHPDMGPALPTSMAILAVYRYEPQFGFVRQEDRDAWQAQVATPEGLKQAFRDALQARGSMVFADAMMADEGPLVRQALLRNIERIAGNDSDRWAIQGCVAKALAAGVPATALVPHVTKAFDPHGYQPAQGAPLAAFARVAAEPSIDHDTFVAMASVAAPWAAQYLTWVNAVSDETFAKVIAFIQDPRLTAAERSALLSQTFAAASRWGARRAAEVLIQLGTTPAEIAALVQDRPDTMLDVTPVAISSAAFTQLTSRATVFATHLDSNTVDEARVRAAVDAYLERPLTKWWTETMAAKRWNGTPRPWPSASSLIATATASITQDTLRLLAGAPDLGSLTDEQVTSFFARPGWSAEIVEPYFFEADVARGKGYVELKAAHGSKAPLAWAASDDGMRTSEAVAFEVLLSNPPYASPLWEGALLNAAAQSTRVDDDFRRQRILGGMTTGYLTRTSLDSTWDAFDALESYRGGTLEFAAPRLARYGERLRSMADPRDLFALEPLLVDPRLPEGIARDTLFVAADASVNASDYGWGEHPARALCATILRTLDERPELSTETRTALLRTTTLLLGAEKVAPADQKMRRAFVQWVTADRSGATFTTAAPARTVRRFTRFVPSPGSTADTVLEFAITSPDDGTAASTYWVAPVDAVSHMGPTTATWAGPFTLSAL